MRSIWTSKSKVNKLIKWYRKSIGLEQEEEYPLSKTDSFSAPAPNLLEDYPLITKEEMEDFNLTAHEADQEWTKLMDQVLEIKRTDPGPDWFAMGGSEPFNPIEYDNLVTVTSFDHPNWARKLGNITWIHLGMEYPINLEFNSDHWDPKDYGLGKSF